MRKYQKVISKMNPIKLEQFKETASMIYKLADRIFFTWDVCTNGHYFDPDELDRQYFKRMYDICKAMGETKELAEALYTECLLLHKNYLCELREEEFSPESVENMIRMEIERNK